MQITNWITILFTPTVISILMVSIILIAFAFATSIKIISLYAIPLTFLTTYLTLIAKTLHPLIPESLLIPYVTTAIPIITISLYFTIATLIIPYKDGSLDRHMQITSIKKYAYMILILTIVAEIIIGIITFLEKEFPSIIVCSAIEFILLAITLLMLKKDLDESKKGST